MCAFERRVGCFDHVVHVASFSILPEKGQPVESVLHCLLLALQIFMQP